MHLQPPKRVEFAPALTINAHRKLADDFTHRVLDLEWALLTDESSLWDFHLELSNDEYVRRIQQVYGVDISDFESGNIARILTRILTSQAEEPNA